VTLYKYIRSTYSFKMRSDSQPAQNMRPGSSRKWNTDHENSTRRLGWPRKAGQTKRKDYALKPEAASQYPAPMTAMGTPQCLSMYNRACRPILWLSSYLDSYQGWELETEGSIDATHAVMISPNNKTPKSVCTTVLAAYNSNIVSEQLKNLNVLQVLTDEYIWVIGLVTLMDNKPAIHRKNPNIPVTALPTMKTDQSFPLLNHNILISPFKRMQGSKSRADNRLLQ